jgi:hypothetical protein
MYFERVITAKIGRTKKYAMLGDFRSISAVTNLFSTVFYKKPALGYR